MVSHVAKAEMLTPMERYANSMRLQTLFIPTQNVLLRFWNFDYDRP